MTEPPTFRGRQLVVDGRAALLLGGQLHNSVPSSSRHNESAVARVADMHARLVIGSASWAQVEPEEGSFDFSTVDAQLDHARAHGLRMALIWFGAFKNAGSTFAPGWVRSDPQRFPRAVIEKKGDIAWTYAGQTAKPVLSVFSPELRDADRRAFCSMMQHLADHDADHTIVMVQVQNEVGLLGDSRDRCPLALAAWDDLVPTPLVERLGMTAGSWEAVFGTGPEADEMFMAWAFADYCNDLARAAKAIKPLPMYVNAWQGPQPGQPLPGDYPSGGPTVNVLDVWKVAAPSLDLLAPDISMTSRRPSRRMPARTTRSSSRKRDSEQGRCSTRSAITTRWASPSSASTMVVQTANSLRPIASWGHWRNRSSVLSRRAVSKAFCSRTNGQRRSPSAATT